MPDVVQIRIEVDGANAPATLQSLVSSLNLVTTAIKGGDTASKAAATQTAAMTQAVEALRQAQLRAGEEGIKAKDATLAQSQALTLLRSAQQAAATGSQSLTALVQRQADALAAVRQATEAHATAALHLKSVLADANQTEQQVIAARTNHAQTLRDLNVAQGQAASATGTFRTALAGLKGGHEEAGAASTAHSKVLGVLHSAFGTAQSGATSLLGVMRQFASNLVGGIASLPDHFKRTGDEANTASGHVGVLRQALASLGQYVGVGAAIAAGMGLLHGALEAIGGLKDTFIGVNAQLEQTRLRFAVFLGDADQARGFVKQLQDEASRSTFGLNQIEAAAGSLLAYNVSATQVIPILRGIQNAAAAAGGDLNENFATLSRVIGELAGGLPITERQVRQLVQAGIPLKPLADQLGITVDQLLNVGKTGIITSAQFVAAFTEIYTHGKLGDYMHEQAQTFTGAMQLVRTDLQIAGATAFKPFFDILRDGLVAVSVFVQSDAWGVWSQRISTGTQIAAAALRSLFGEVRTAFDGIKDVLARFEQGGIAGVFQPLLDAGRMAVANLLHTFEDGGNGFFAAGANLIATYASGMWQSATGILSSVVNEIADFIGQFFIGQSPPPKGPLKQIHQGGATLMQAYVDGMWEGLGGLSDIGKNVLDQLTNAINTGGEGGFDFATLKDNIQSGVLSMDELKASGEGVDDVLAMITSSLGDIADKQAGIKDQEADIKDHYDSIIDPLQRQLDILKETVDYTTKRRDLELEIADNNINLAMANDPTLQGLDKTLSNLQAQKAKAAVAPINRADENRIADLQRQERALPSGTAGAARRKQIQDEIAGIQDRDRVAKDGQTDAQRALDAQIQSVKDQIDARKAGYQQQLDANKEEKNKVDLLGKQKDLAKQLLELPLEQKIAAAKREEADRLDPLIKASTEYDKQTRALDTQKRGWDGLKTSIADALQPITEANKYQASLDAQAKSASAAAKKTKPGGDSGGPIPGIDQLAIPKLPALTFTPPDFTKMGEHAAESLINGAKTFIEHNFGSLIGSAVGGALGSALGPVGAVAGSLLGGAVGKGVQTKLAELGVDLPTMLAGVQSGLQRFGEFLSTTVLPNAMSLFGWLRENVPLALGAIGAFIDGTALPALQRFGGWITETGLPALRGFGAWILGEGLSALRQLGGWFETTGLSVLQRFGSFVTSTLVPAVKQISNWIVQDGLPALLRFGTFIDQSILPIVQRMASFFVEHMLPVLTTWWSFLLNNIMPILETWWGFLANKVVPVLADVASWVMDHVIPAARSMWSFIDQNVIPVFQSLWAYLNGSVVPVLKDVASWFGDHILPVVTSVAAFVGGTLLQTLTSLWDGINTKLVPAVKDAWTWFNDKILPVVKDVASVLTATVKPAFDLITTAVGLMLTGLKDVWTWVDKSWGAIEGKLSGPFSAAEKVFQGFMSGLGKGIAKVGDFFDIANLKTAGEGLENLFAPSGQSLGTGRAPGAAGGGAGQGGGPVGLPSIAARPSSSAGRGGLIDGIVSGGARLVGDAAGKGVDWLIEQATKLLPSLSMPGIFSGFGASFAGTAKTGLIDLVKGLFGKQSPVAQRLGGAAYSGPIPTGGYQDVVSKALGSLGSQAWFDASGNTLCEGFAEQMERLAGYSEAYWPSAAAHGYGVSHIPGFPGPPGSMMHWGTGFWPVYGHAGISMGDGTIVSTSSSGIARYNMAGAADYLGWLPPGLANGGITQSEGIYHLHPREAVIPLDKAGRGGGGIGGDTHIHMPITVTGSVVTDKQLTATVRQGLEELARQGVTLKFT